MTQAEEDNEEEVAIETETVTVELEVDVEIPRDDGSGLFDPLAHSLIDGEIDIDGESVDVNASHTRVRASEADQADIRVEIGRGIYPSTAFIPTTELLRATKVAVAKSECIELPPSISSAE